ncbi:hypothetical protein RKE29_30230, partial [Streptomyces sp. B1866]|nr:hypothetical protein [Streptomyces sp. B1866]
MRRVAPGGTARCTPTGRAHPQRLTTAPTRRARPQPLTAAPPRRRAALAPESPGRYAPAGHASRTGLPRDGRPA